MMNKQDFTYSEDYGDEDDFIIHKDADWDGMVRDSLARTNAMAKHGQVDTNRDEIKAEDRK